MKRKQLNVAAIFAFAVLCFGFNFGISTSAQNSRPRITPTPTPTITPTPKVSVTPTPTPTPHLTLPEVQAKIQNVLARPDLQRGQIGVKIVSLDTNKIVFEQNAEKYFMPASNMKGYTIAAAIEKLSPDFRFVTSVLAPAMPDASGTIKGDLTIYGRGDISISTAFNDGDYYRGLDALAQKIVSAGVKRIEGNLVGDESYFSGNPIPAGWEWDDLQWYYGAEISALPVNDNAVDLSVKPGGAAGSQCFIQTLPANTIFKIVNRCATVAVGTKREIRVVKKLDQNIVEVSGTMPFGDKGYKGALAVSRPSQIFVELLRGLLMQKGVIIAGQNKVINAPEKFNSAMVSASAPIEIAKLESPPLSLIAAKTLKPSQNTYTETILWTLGEEIGRKQQLFEITADNLIPPPKTSSELGLSVVGKFLNEIGMPPGSLIQWDGSGLSRHDLVTPASAVALYTFMSKSRYAAVWRDALTIGAIDGTLRNRFKGTLAANNVRGKTGTIDQVSSLSGYVTTAEGERMVFSIIVNNVEDTQLRQSTIDEIVIALASLNGKSN
ncbi:MAG: D-alanyl-D-alanine carboxypeptidase/D-alanyl-D-alanine-endopeptidase [Pyrinomonadaceae bacterium]|nr:D-alanyl-D-alanine carboxypeptidase/D-alanyl-D-alanine-endopeptidase [Pyrinomonadaceae bacterium]